jgi:hypothetical protein
LVLGRSTDLVVVVVGASFPEVGVRGVQAMASVVAIAALTGLATATASASPTSSPFISHQVGGAAGAVTVTAWVNWI